ncbi:MAG: hypothetical protein JNK82_10595 [Myxococcaceae bacterium]|nr:hypothetical protein [Myxococcaceae bacterium]
MKALHYRLAALALWLTLLGVSFATAPPASPDTGEVVVMMMTGRFDGVNLSLVALFNLMGVWPLAMWVALRFDRPWWRWPFIAGSFALGAFVLLPYLVMRPWLAPREPPGSRVGRFLGHRLVHGALWLAGLGLVVLFFVGDLPGFVALWKSQQFPYVMSLDFIAMTLARGLLWVEARGGAAGAR